MTQPLPWATCSICNDIKHKYIQFSIMNDVKRHTAIARSLKRIKCETGNLEFWVFLRINDYNETLLVLGFCVPREGTEFIFWC